ncbi:MAG: protein kinase [Myxococcales bacterium]|nr:protein kinase [Myxococcales bacterium]
MAAASCPQCQSPYDPENHRFCPSCGFPVAEVSIRPDDPLIGKTFPGGYVLLDLIGIGGMGRVYRAEQKALGRTVAVKVIHAHLHGEEGAAARFITEARAASRLNHPNVVSVIDFGRSGPNEGNLLYLVMEYLRGRDLSRVAYEEGPLSFARIVDILKQTLAALDEAHHLGIIHRDVKPENIVLEPTRGGGDFVKVVDFGLAKLRPDMMSGIVSGGTGITSPGIVCGTPDYMSPEQGRGDPLDARSDLYALGVIMFQLLTGQLPFEAASPTQVVLMHLQQPPPDPRKLVPERRIPDPLAEVCLLALAKDRRQRYADAPAFVRALDAAMAAITPQPKPRMVTSVACPSCSAPVPATQKFCGECGFRISPSSPVPAAPQRASERPPRPGSTSRGRSVPPPASTPAPVVEPPITLNTPEPSGAPVSSAQPPTQPERPSRLDTPRLPLPLPLLGREDDLSWLDDRLREAHAGLRGARLVGEIGVGKTRLLGEFLAQARNARHRVVEIQPDPAWAEVGYHGLADAIEKLAGISASTDLSRVKIDARDREQVLRGLHEVVVKPLGTTMTADVRRFAAAAALRWALARAAQDADGRTLVLALDDLPRYDGATRHAFSDVLGEPPVGPILIVATHPSGFDAGWPAGRSLARVITGLSPAIASTAFRGLGPHGMASAAERLKDSDARGIAPLYLDQLVRFAQEAGGPAPPRIADLVAARIERLGADARRVLQAAAVLGDDVTEEAIGAVLGGQIARPRVHQAIEQCRRGGLLEEQPAGERFAHPLFRDVAAASLPAGARRDLHARTFDLAAQDDAPLEVRALHAFFGQSALEALMLLEQVADRCTRRGDDEGAILALRRSLELARRALFRGDIDDPERAVVIFSRKLGEALARAGYLTDAEGILREALDLAGPADTDRAKVLEGLARVARSRERSSEAEALLKEAIATAHRSGARELLVALRQLESDWRAA